MLLASNTVRFLVAVLNAHMTFYHTTKTTASPERIWQLWTGVANWPSWDTELESAALEGNFTEGAKGTLKAVGSPRSTFIISACKPGSSYTFSTRLPLCQLHVTRRLTPLAAGTSFTHEVSFTGLLAPLFGRLLGRRYRQVLPQAMENLKQQAEALSSVA